jgi:putative transposase
MVIYPEYLSKEPIRTSKKQKKLARQLTSPLKKDARLVVDRVGRWFLHIPVQQPVETQDRFPLEREGLAAIDPGVCAFLSYYSPDRQVAGQIGVQYDRDMLFRLCELLDDLVSRMYKAKGKPLGPDSENIGSRRRHKMKKAEHRLRIRIRNKVKDIHHKAAHFLTTHFRYILLPKFDVSKMTKKEDDQGNRRILRNKSVRQMLTWSHYRFRQVLLHQAHKRSCKVLLCQEDYTSKTCGRCGRTYKVGGSRVFECSTCHFKANRDIQAARNICIKHLSVL